MNQAEIAAPSSRGLIVLGMHRSGTSAITRGLQSLGVDLGGDFLPTRFDNPTGYWEDAAIVELHDRLLALFGMTWEDWAPIDEASWSAPAVSLFIAEARHYVVSHFLNRPLWAFKDPRTLRMLPFWRLVLAPLHVDVSYLLIVRNPLSVVESLHRRQSMDHQTAHALWLAYVVLNVGSVPADRLVVVDYDLFMDNPMAELERISARLHIAPQAANAAARAEYVGEFLQPGLRHSRHSAAELVTEPGVPQINRKAYLLLLALAKDQLDPGSMQFRDEWTILATAARKALEPR